MSDLKEREQEFIRLAVNANLSLSHEHTTYKCIEILNQNQFQEFLEYWTEVTRNKMRFELYSDFDMKKELELWQLLPDGFLRIWGLWKVYKNVELKFKYRSRLAEVKAMKKLLRLSNSDVKLAEQIVDQSITDGWQGLYPLKKDYNGSGKDTRTSIELFADTLKSKFGKGNK